MARFNNKAYLLINVGEIFGHVDCANNRSFIDGEESTTVNNRHEIDMIRRFTVQAFEPCEILGLSINDLLKMKYEFPRQFEEIFDSVRERFRRDLILKFEVIKHMEMQHAAKTPDAIGAMRSRFAGAFLGEILKEMNTNRDLLNTHSDESKMKINQQLFKQAKQLNQQRKFQAPPTTNGLHAHCEFCRSIWGPTGCQDKDHQNYGSAMMSLSNIDEQEEDGQPGT